MVRKEYPRAIRNFLRMSCKFLLPRRRFSSGASTEPQQNHCLSWNATEAAELLEFALLLPILLVMVVGLMDFATAYNIKQKLANAAREGARMGSSQPVSDLDTSDPASIDAIKDDVVTYLQQAGVNTSFINPTLTYKSTPPYKATYYSSTSGGTNYGLEIERRVPITSGGVTIFVTRVTLTYPYDWTYGFNHVIKLLIPSATSAGQIGIETDATMAELN